MTLHEVNALTVDAFISKFADVAEHSPWVAAVACKARPYASREAMTDAFADAVRQATLDAQLALIRAHPALAAKAKLTAASRSEQRSAGLDALTPDEMAEFTRLNVAYGAKFGFPFIFAVKGADTQFILASFASRLGSSAEEELRTALSHICTIARFRIEDRVKG
jgi:2-oxo-4-hydroxy-4-carboxy-5-ureidoimidazoline decarboxylase